MAMACECTSIASIPAWASALAGAPPPAPPQPLHPPLHALHPRVLPPGNPLPPPRPPLQAERLASHVDSKLWPEVDNAVAAANRMGGPQRPYVRQLLTPALRMMEALLERWVGGLGCWRGW